MPCPTKKISYSTEKEAKEALWLIKFWGISWWKQHRFYRCPLCGEYHLTSKEDQRKK